MVGWMDDYSRVTSSTNRLMYKQKNKLSSSPSLSMNEWRKKRLNGACSREDGACVSFRKKWRMHASCLPDRPFFAFFLHELSFCLRIIVPCLIFIFCLLASFCPSPLFVCSHNMLCWQALSSSLILDLQQPAESLFSLAFWTESERGA